MIFLLCFDNNGMKANADKCPLLLSTKEKIKARISNYTIMNYELQRKTAWSNNR